MNLRNLLCLSMFVVNFIVADNRHLAPKNMTDEELQQQLEVQAQREAAIAEARALEEAYIAQVQSNIINFAQAPHCDQTAIDYILQYLENKSLWDFWISLADPADNAVIRDIVNVIHFVAMFGKAEQLTFLCKQLNRIQRLDFLNTPTKIQNIVPTTFCMHTECWDCLTILIEYGANGRGLIIPERIAADPEKLKLCEDAIKKGLMLHRQYLAEKKMKAKKAEKKARTKIERLEAQAFKKVENFYYGIDSGTDSDSD